MSKRKTEMVVVRHHDGSHTIRALSDGPFAVHRPFDGSGFIETGWAVTHRPTGYSLGRLRSEEKAWAYVAELRHRFKGEAWNFRGPKSKKWRELRQRVRSIAEHHKAIPY